MNSNDIKDLITVLGFSPKENASGIFEKKYPDGYIVSIDFHKETINYGNKIKADSKTTQNFSQPENFVVLECVNRLLEKGYKPQNIVLEKTFPLGHNSGRLDILVTREDGTAYLMIECKTFGKEFDEELKSIQRNGGQLFTYFQQDTKAELLMLYTSKLSGKEIVSDYKVIQIEDKLRLAGNVEETHRLWKSFEKRFADNHFWENLPYNSQTEIFTKTDLQELTKTEGDKLFNKFAEILRKHSVSDKPNAFNVIFNLFLAKLYDEQKRDGEELEFKWRKNDDPVDFQVRLYNLHKEGLNEFLKKEIEGIYDKDFANKSGNELKDAKKRILKINKLFDIRNVLDDDDFEQNHRVLLEVVKLLQKYRIRYPRKQQYLSEFFERLLTIGLKQEAGQFFTPPPVTKFIIKSLPLQYKIEQELNNPIFKLPAVIDYATGSGHFLTEILEEYQNIIDNLAVNTSKYSDDAAKKIKSWSKDINPYSWAATYIYGIEKDYRLVKVAKVGCYFYGDGLAQVIYGDGLDSFAKSKSYRGLLKDNAKKPQFSVVVSNPPYAVNFCKDDLEYIEAHNDFEIYKYLTDKSKEIECLFVERTKQLLKDDGIAGIILPSSILSNEGIYTKAREIILQYFDIIAITELGSNTFMATGTNTVVLFLRKRNDAEVTRIKEAAYNLANNYPKTHEDLVINGIEKPIKNFLDYTEQTDETKIDPEKFYYFVLNYHQRVVLVKTGEKDAEKRFLGYEFSNRRGYEGMHSVVRGKNIEDVTKLFNENNYEDETKASTYIHKAFNGDYDFPIHESLKNNIFSVRLIDMLTFDRVKFEKIISTAVKKKVRYEEIWKTDKLISINEISLVQKGTSITKEKTIEGIIPVVAGGKEIAYFHNIANRNGNIITISASGAYSGFVNYFENPIFASDCNTIQSRDENIISTKLIYLFLKSIQKEIYFLQKGQAQPHVYAEDLRNINIPLPPKEIQKKIVTEIEVLERKEGEAKEKIGKLTDKIHARFRLEFSKSYKKRIGDCFKLSSGKMLSAKHRKNGDFPVYGGNGITGVHNEFLVEMPTIVIGRVGEYCGSIHISEANSWITDNALYVVTFLEEFDIKYLYYILKECNLNIYANKTAQPNISQTILNPILIPTPPLSEQRKIVSEIEKIETQIADFERQLSEIPKQKEEILKKYL